MPRLPESAKERPLLGLCSHYIYSSMGRGLELDPADGAFIKRVDAFTDPPGLFVLGHTRVLVVRRPRDASAHSRLRQVPAQAGGAGG